MLKFREIPETMTTPAIRSGFPTAASRIRTGKPEAIRSRTRLQSLQIPQPTISNQHNTQTQLKKQSED